MRGGFSSARGPLEFSSGKSDAKADPGQEAQLQTAAQLAREGWDVSIGSGGADIVATDPSNKAKVRIDVKVAPRGKAAPVFVSDPESPVDIHVFVSHADDADTEFWVIPTEAVRTKGHAGVLQNSVATEFLGAWDVLKHWPR